MFSDNFRRKHIRLSVRLANCTARGGVSPTQYAMVVVFLLSFNALFKDPEELKSSFGGLLCDKVYYGAGH